MTWPLIFYLVFHGPDECRNEIDYDWHKDRFLVVVAKFVVLLCSPH